MSRLRKEPLSSIEFFWDLNRKFLICKRVLSSCESEDQVNACSTWIANVMLAMENKMNVIREGYSVYHSSAMYQKFKDSIHDMFIEWNRLVEEQKGIIKQKNPPPGVFPKCQQPYKSNGIGFHTF